MITRILSRLRRRRWTEPDTLTRLPVPAPVRVPPAPPVCARQVGDDELAVRARLFCLLGIGGPL
ncbi:hypothetical protein GXW83_27385 [Streptacidiphilus sp. PB12-B1b]|uniref:hypothetical protein n=1 Tax=Streptacidiphilus sp. PB12-B1b TaxID=2705012 RepID=UPI0015F9B713|nr:hypothetical protein [Streptacidiphilus sp. PB12-B1b]QMU78869.1 hypothetical protein GXW83_27385 [Streptacidiphilus sp. PB12-B1b]